MFAWIVDNLATVGVCAVLVAVMAAIIVKLIKDKKAGKSSCGGNCAACPMCCGCKTPPPKK